MRSRHDLSLPAALLIAALMLCACARGDLSTVPSVQGVNQAAPVGADSAAAPSITHRNARPNVDCPTRFYDCTTVSLKNGAVIMWCSGTRKKPCKNTNKYIWSGIVCLAKGATCKKPIKQLTAKWSGPFTCKPKDKCKGTYVVDTLTPGPGLKVTKKYIYKQEIRMCAGSACTHDYSGINVEK